MVKTLAPGRAWSGQYFLGHTDELVPVGDRLENFRRQVTAIAFN
jgi:hypothetical protein